MYCKKCGTENPDGRLKCERCNAFLSLRYSPLNGRDRIKIVLFFLLLAGTMFFGVIPILIALAGIYIMKKDNDYIPILNSKRHIKSYLILLFLGGVVLAGSAYYVENVETINYKKYSLAIENSSPDEYVSRYDYYEKNKNIEKDTLLVVVVGLILMPIAIALFMWVFNILYFKPLEKHREWVVINGIFADKEKDEHILGTTGIIGRDNLSSYSIADEMIKWNDMLEKGLITQEEFDKAKQRLLN